MASLNQYYVGEICLTQKKDDIVLRARRYKLLQNGAIDLITELDPKENIVYNRMFTIFLEKDGKYYCLHDKEAYEREGMTCCANLVSLKNILPVIGYRFSWKDMSTKHALYIFELMFKNGVFLKQDKLFDNTKRLLLEKLYVGNLRLSTGYNPCELEKGQYQYQNLAHQMLLMKSDASLLSKEELHGNYDILFGGTYQQAIYQSIFLDYSHKGMYNLHNSGFYGQRPTVYESTEIQDDCCGNLVPLKEALNQTGIACKEKEISVPQALKLYRKLKRRKK